mgnify:CR=1 FL=1
MVQKVRNATYSIVVYRILVTLAWLFAFYDVFTSKGTTPFSINNQKLYLYNVSVKWYLWAFLLDMITINRRYRAYL